MVTNSYSISDENKKKLNSRLDKLAEFTKEINAIPVFITQKTLRHKIVNNKIYSIDDVDYYSREKIISQTIIDNCKKNKIFCIDLFNKIEFTENSLYDLSHASPEGAEIISGILFEEFNKNFDNF